MTAKPTTSNPTTVKPPVIGGLERSPRAMPGIRDSLMNMIFAVGSLTVAWVVFQGAAADEGKPQAAAARMTDPDAFAQLTWDTSGKGREIDLSLYTRTFHDDFKSMNIVKEDSSPGPGAIWFSPGHGDFRTSSPLRKDGPFSLVDDGLRMRVDKVGNRWRGACMTTVNTRGEGFAQQYGYFEATIRYEYAGPKKGIWGAFWAKSQKDFFSGGTTTRAEIDFNEFYGDDGYHATVHLWPAEKPQPGETVLKHIYSSGMKARLARDHFKALKEDGVVRGFHVYGGEITPEWFIIYFDRKELGRFPTMPEWKTPLYLLLDVIVNKVEEEKAVFPMDMTVKDVSAYLPLHPYSP